MVWKNLKRCEVVIVQKKVLEFQHHLILLFSKIKSSVPVMRSIVCLVLTSLSITTYSQNQLGIFQSQIDIGNPEIEGWSTHDPMKQIYTLSGAGYNIWFERDEFHYLHRKVQGDFILTGRFAFEGEGMEPHRKIGFMIRESEDEQAAHISATLHGDGLTVLQWRELRGAFMRDPEDEAFAPKSNYQIMQLERKGSQFIMRAAHPGEPLQWIGSHTMKAMPHEVLTGIFICSHNPEAMEEGYAFNVRLERRTGENLLHVDESVDVVNHARSVVDTLKEYSSYSTERSGSGPYFSSMATGTNQIWKANADLDSSQITFDQYHNWMPSLSPDGQMLAFYSAIGSDQKNELKELTPLMLRLIPTNGGGAQVLVPFFMGCPESIKPPRWGGDGKVYFTRCTSVLPRGQ